MEVNTPWLCCQRNTEFLIESKAAPDPRFPQPTETGKSPFQRALLTGANDRPARRPGRPSRPTGLCTFVTLLFAVGVRNVTPERIRRHKSAKSRHEPRVSAPSSRFPANGGA